MTILVKTTLYFRKTTNNIKFEKQQNDIKQENDKNCENDAEFYINEDGYKHKTNNTHQGT